MGLDRFQKTPCGFCFVEYYTHQDALDCMKYIGGTKLDERIIRTDLDEGFSEGRQFGYVEHPFLSALMRLTWFQDVEGPGDRSGTNIVTNMIQVVAAMGELMRLSLETTNNGQAHPQVVATKPQVPILHSQKSCTKPERARSPQLEASVSCSTSILILTTQQHFHSGHAC